MSRYVQSLPDLFSHFRAVGQHLLGLVYLGTAFGLVLPFVISLVPELYIFVPLYDFLSLEAGIPGSKSSQIATDTNRTLPPPPTIFILQSWTLGLLHLRLALRLILHYPTQETRVARATRAIVRDGWWHPDVRLATRALLVPALVVCSTLLFVPPTLSKGVMLCLNVHEPNQRATICRMSYPGFLAIGSAIRFGFVLKKQIAKWRMKIRDEVYLIGERLHNFQETKKSRTGNGRHKTRAGSGPGRMHVDMS